MKKTLYDVLGVNKNSTPEEIKKAYRKKAKENHTDKQGGDHDKMVEITKAYSVLSITEKRTRYDSTGQTEDVPFEQKFAGFVNDVFLKVIDQVDVVHSDLVVAFVATTKGIIGENEKEQKKMVDKMDKLNKVVERLSGDERISIVIKGNIQGYTELINQSEETISFLKKCLEVLEHCDYKFEEKTFPGTRYDGMSFFTTQ